MDERFAREAFGWGPDASFAAGPRGALGQIWRVEAGPDRYALKELFAEPPTEARIAEELALAGRATAAGVRLPACIPAASGQYLATAPDGRNWLRLYEWVDLTPVDLAAPGTPERVGELLARLHRAAPADTTPVNRWYERVPPVEDFATAAASGAPWAPRLADRLPSLPGLCAAMAPADTARLVTCHRDLHPDNVLADPSGAYVVVDWDNFGPADPARELALTLFDWFGDPVPDLDRMRLLLRAYERAGGPGRVTGPADFTMLVAIRLNFLRIQLGILADPAAEPRWREWAEREVDEALRMLPTPQHLADVLAIC